MTSTAGCGRSRRRWTRACCRASTWSPGWTAQLHPADQGGPPVRGPLRPPLPRLMLQTAEHLMGGCGFKVVYGFTQSDEISPALRAGGERLRAEAPQAALGPRRRGQRQVLAAPGGAGGVRLPHLATPLGGVRRRLLPLAQRGRPPQRPERPLLLAAAEAGPGCRRGHGGAAGPVGLGQERVALPGRHQLQRPPGVAEAGRRGCTGRSTSGPARTPSPARRWWPDAGGSAATSNCR